MTSPNQTASFPPALVVGAIVSLNDGEDTAMVVAVRDDEVDVIHTDRVLGAGPWTFHSSQVAVVG